MSESTSEVLKSKAEAAQDLTEQLMRLWEQGQRPDVRALLARAEPLTAAQLAAVLRVDQRQRWRSGERVLAEAYLQDFPELRTDPDAPIDLVYNEFLLRERQGEQPDPAEYSQRFPEYAGVLGRQIDLHRAMAAANDGSSRATDIVSPRQSARQADELSRAGPPGGPAVPGYEILEELGRGGMGVVYKARHLRLKRVVALKMLLAGGHADQEQLARFRTEAEAVARLQHPNIVQIYEVGDAEGRPFLALEFVAGGNLKTRLSGAPLASAQAARLVETLALAVQFAHQHGVVHRDLKPANILLASGRVVSGEWSDSDAPRESPFTIPQLTTHQPKITDFGLAKQLESELSAGSGTPTETGAVLGTPNYMAPEQAAGRRALIGPASDVYALGAILYELLTGRPPFQGQTPLDTLQQVLADEPLAPSRFQKVPRDLETICLKCLEKDPPRRYASAAALAEDLRRFQAGESIVARPVGRLARAWRWSRRNPAWAAMGTSVAILVLIGVTGLLIGMAQMRQALDTAETNLDRATAAEKKVQTQYFEALLAQAQSNHRGRRPGQRFESLRLVNEAGLGLPDRRLAELRTVAINALAMPDLYVTKKWQGFPAGSTGVAFDETLSRYARTDEAGNCTVCRVLDDKEVVLRSLPGLGAKLATFSPRMSPDGRFVAVLYLDGRMQLWNVEDSRAQPWFEVKRAAGKNSMGPFLDFAASSRQAALAHVDGQITHYDLEARQETPFKARELDREVMVAMHPSEPLAAVGSYYPPYLVQVRDLRSGAVRQRLPHPRGTHSCAWHPLGRRLATAGADDDVIRIFDVTSGRLVRHFGPCGGGARLAFNHAGDRLVEGDNWTGHVRLWDVTSGRQLCVHPPVSFLGTSLRFSPDNRQLGGCVEGTQLVLWRVGDGREYRTLVRQAMPASQKCLAAAVHPAGRLLAVAMSDGVGFWNLDSGEELRFLPIRLASSLAFEPEESGALIVTGGSGTWRCPIHCDATAAGGYRVDSPRRFADVRAHRISISKDRGVMALATRRVEYFEKFAGAWIRKPGSKRFEPVHGGDVGYATVSPDGLWLVTAQFSDSGLNVFDTRTLALVKQIPEAWGHARFSLNGHWLATTQGDVRLWRVGPNISDWSPGPAIRIAGASFEFSPDNRLLALSTPRGQIRLFDVEGQSVLAEFEDPELRSGTLTFSPDSSRLIAVHPDGVHVWDLRRIRSELDILGQDWSLPSYPPEPVESPKSKVQSNLPVWTFAFPPLIGPPAIGPPLLAATLAKAEVTVSKIMLACGRVAGEAGWRDGAWGAYSAALQLRPDDPEALLYRAEEYLRRRQWSQAIADLSRVLGDPNRRLTALFYRSVAAAQLGRHADAEADRRVLGGAYPNFTVACYQQAVQRARAGDALLALVLVDACAQLMPDEPVPANAVAWALVTNPPGLRDAARALPLAQKAVAMKPASPAYRNTLGVVLYRLERYAEAEEFFQDSPKLDYPDAALDLYCLAMCEAKLGRTAQAKRYFDRADAWRAAHPPSPTSALAQAAELNDFRAEAAAALAQAGSRKQGQKGNGERP